MDIQILGFLGFVFSATALIALAFEHRLDVLHGPYIQGRIAGRAGFSVKRFLKPGTSAIDRLLSLEGLKHDPYAASIAAC
jgi:hypothetical protein